MNLQKEAERFADGVARYLRPSADELQRYSWPIRKHAKLAAAELGLNLERDTGGLAATHALRRAVAMQIREVHALSEPERTGELIKLCGFVIRKWGGLASNKDGTIAQYAERFTRSTIFDLATIESLDHLEQAAVCRFEFDGISSWSKWLNFVWPDWALIYDARIAFALNAIHFMEDIDARAFPVPAGRDNLLSSIDTQAIATLKYLSRRGDKPPQDQTDNAGLVAFLARGAVEPDHAYRYYLFVMQGVRQRLGTTGENALVEAEMLLFYLSNQRVVRDLVNALSHLFTAGRST